MDQFVLKVPDLDEGLSRRSYELSAPWLDGQLANCDGIGAFGSTGKLDLDITRRGGQVLLRGRIFATLAVRCVRCLGDYEFPVDAEVDVLMLPGRGPATKPTAKDDVEGDEDDLGVERYEGEQIVLDDLLRDMILLEVPMNPNCGDGCPGWDHLIAE